MTVHSPDANGRCFQCGDLICPKHGTVLHARAGKLYHFHDLTVCQHLERAS